MAATLGHIARQPGADAPVLQCIGVIGQSHIRIMREMRGLHAIGHAQIGQQPGQARHQRLLHTRQMQGQRRRGQHQPVHMTQAGRDKISGHQSTQAVPQQHQGLMPGHGCTCGIEHHGQIVEQAHIAGQAALRPARQAVAVLVIGPHRKAELVEPLRQRGIAAAVLAQAMHQQHLGTGLDSRRQRPVAQRKLGGVRCGHMQQPGRRLGTGIGRRHARSLQLARACRMQPPPARVNRGNPRPAPGNSTLSPPKG